MSVNPKLIVVCYSGQHETFHRETLREHTQGNALRILKGHAVAYHAIAVVDTPEQADRAVDNFTLMQRVARGSDAPLLRPSSASDDDLVFLRPRNEVSQESHSPLISQTV